MTIRQSLINEFAREDPLYTRWKYPRPEEIIRRIER